MITWYSPRFFTVSVMALLERLVLRCLNVPRGGSSGNVLLWGVRGVGKSTVLLFTAVAAAVH